MKTKIILFVLLASVLFTGCIHWPGIDNHKHHYPIQSPKHLG